MRWDQVRPILENSTACTMSNAKNLVWLDPFLAVKITGDSFGNRYINNKQVSNDLFLSVSNLSPRQPIPAAGDTKCAITSVVSR